MAAAEDQLQEAQESGDQERISEAELALEAAKDVADKEVQEAQDAAENAEALAAAADEATQAAEEV